jgi:hypothetical protein
MLLAVQASRTLAGTTNAPVRVWDRRFGGSSSEWLLGLAAEPDGGFLLGGFSASGVSGDKTEISLGGQDQWLVRVDASGAKLWDHRFGGSLNEYFVGVHLTSDGGAVSGGGSRSGISGDRSESNRGNDEEDFWIVRTTTNGVKVWDHRFGGGGQDSMTAICPSSDGGYLLGGYSNSDPGGDVTENRRSSSGNYDMWVVKVDSNGVKQWDHRFGGTTDNRASAVIQTADGGFLIAGNSNSGTNADKSENCRGGYDFWAVKIGTNGVKQWDHRFGGSGDDAAPRIAPAADGGWLLAGSSYSGADYDKSHTNRGVRDYWVVKIGTNGVKQWDSCYGGTGNDELQVVIATSDGGHLLGGESSSGIGGEKTEDCRGGLDYWIVKIDTNGVKQWDRRFGGASDDRLRGGIVEVAPGRYLLAGLSASGVGPDKTQASQGSEDYWILLVSSWARLDVSWVSGGTGGGTSVYTNDINATVTQSCSAQIVSGGTQYCCNGWVGTGSVPASGTSNVVSFTITNDSTLAWLWQTNVLFSRTAGPDGTVTGSTNGWYAIGSSVTVTAAPNPGCTFAGWTGDVPAGQTNQNPLTLTLDQARNVAACFFRPAAGPRYVAEANPTAAFPYTNWFMAAATIQDAVDAAKPGETVWVSNGVYRTGGRPIHDAVSNRVAITKAVTVQSVNGPSETVIQGDMLQPGRCVYMTNGATLAGFVLSNSIAWPPPSTLSLTCVDGDGAGVWCADRSAVVSNCVIRGNTATGRGGGAYRGTLIRCSVLENNVHGFGGGVSDATLIDCEVARNMCGAGGRGAGAYTSRLIRCRIWGNFDWMNFYPGGATVESELDTCLLWGNSDLDGAYGCVGGTARSTTFIQQSVGHSSGMPPPVLHNCILTQPLHPIEAALTNCSTPESEPGAGNVTGDPRFVDAAHGDYRLQPASPCIDAGSNALMSAGTDLDGVSRPRDGDGDGTATVDMGCYERVTTAWKLVVSSPFGSPQPLAGTNYFDDGATVLAAVAGSPSELGSTQYVCAGWFGAGSVPASGAATNLNIVITNHSAIAWLWQTNVWFGRNAGAHGTVTGSTDGWYALGGSVTITAAPNSGCTFAGWTGDVPAGQTNQNPLTLTMDQSRSVSGVFLAQQFSSAIAVSPGSLSFSGLVYAAVEPLTLVVSNAGPGDASYGLASDVFWLSADGTGGSLAAGASTQHTVRVGTRGLAPRTYRGGLVLTPAGTNPPQLAAVTLTVTNPAGPTAVWAWGSNDSGQIAVPSDLTNAVAIEAGDFFSMALRADGRVTAWGNNDNGETSVPAAATNVVAIAAGGKHAIALRSDGTVVVWGRGAEGQKNVPPGLSGVVAVSAAGLLSLALTSNGTIAAWGSNNNGELDVPSEATNVVAISAGAYHGLAVRANGTVVAWGSNGSGEREVPEGLSNVVAVAGGCADSYVLLSNGTLVSWGNFDYGKRDTPAGLSNVVALSACADHTIALVGPDGKVVAWGRNDGGQTNAPSGLAHAFALAGEHAHSLALAPGPGLEVIGGRGASSPPSGLHRYPRAAAVTCMAEAAAVSGATQYCCTGWAGTGSVPVSGTSNVVSFTITNDSTLAWLWQTNVWFSRSAGAHGAVTGATNGWYAIGGSVTVTAVPNAHCTFAGWTGDVSAASQNPLTLTLDQARTVTATFAPGEPDRGTRILLARH